MSELCTTTDTLDMMPVKDVCSEPTFSGISESDGASTGEGTQSLSDFTDAESSSGPVIVSKQHAKLWQSIESHQKYAHSERDIYLVFVYFELAVAAETHISEGAIRLLLAALKLMHQCDFEEYDICSVLAHASAYFEPVYAQCGGNMSDNEMGYILAALVYLAHTYVADENCPLKFWHQRLFRKYSSLKVLDAAIMRIMRLLDFRLRVDEEDLSQRCERLLQAAQEGVISGP